MKKLGKGKKDCAALMENALAVGARSHKSLRDHISKLVENFRNALRKLLKVFAAAIQK